MSSVILNSFIKIDVNKKAINSRVNADLTTLDGISVAYSNDFECVMVRDREDELIGVLIGNPITDRVFINEDVIIDEKSWESFEKTIYKFSGRYIAIGDINGQKKVYLDASGSLPLVYDSEHKATASSPVLIYGDRYESKLDTNSLNKLGMPGSGLWFPSGITAHDGLCRLMHNHYLDLDQWFTKRHWPLDELKMSEEPVEAFKN